MKIIIKESTSTVNTIDSINEHLRAAIKATRVPESSFKFEFDKDWQCDTVSYHTSRSKLLQIRDNIKAAGYTKFDEKLSSSYCTCQYFNDNVFVFIEIDGDAGDVVIVPRCNEASPLAVKNKLFMETLKQTYTESESSVPDLSEDEYAAIKSLYFWLHEAVKQGITDVSAVAAHIKARTFDNKRSGYYGKNSTLTEIDSLVSALNKFDSVVQADKYVRKSSTTKSRLSTDDSKRKRQSELLSSIRNHLKSNSVDKSVTASAVNHGLRVSSSKSVSLLADDELLNNLSDFIDSNFDIPEYLSVLEPYVTKVLEEAEEGEALTFNVCYELQCGYSSGRHITQTIAPYERWYIYNDETYIETGKPTLEFLDRDDSSVLKDCYEFIDTYKVSEKK